MAAACSYLHKPWWILCVDQTGRTTVLCHGAIGGDGGGRRHRRRRRRPHRRLRPYDVYVIQLDTGSSVSYVAKRKTQCTLYERFRSQLKTIPKNVFWDASAQEKLNLNLSFLFYPRQRAGVAFETEPNCVFRGHRYRSVESVLLDSRQPAGGRSAVDGTSFAFDLLAVTHTEGTCVVEANRPVLLGE